MMIIQTVASILSFILLMTLYPDVQKRAQDEIDPVVGQDRVPSIEDQDQLTLVLSSKKCYSLPRSLLRVCVIPQSFSGRADLALI